MREFPGLVPPSCHDLNSATEAAEDIAHPYLIRLTIGHDDDVRPSLGASHLTLTFDADGSHLSSVSRPFRLPSAPRFLPLGYAAIFSMEILHLLIIVTADAIPDVVPDEIKTLTPWRLIGKGVLMHDCHARALREIAPD